MEIIFDNMTTSTYPVQAPVNRIICQVRGEGCGCNFLDVVLARRRRKLEEIQLGKNAFGLFCARIDMTLAQAVSIIPSQLSSIVPTNEPSHL